MSPLQPQHFPVSFGSIHVGPRLWPRKHSHTTLPHSDSVCATRPWHLEAPGPRFEPCRPARLPCGNRSRRALAAKRVAPKYYYNHPWRACDDPAGWPVLAPSSASSRHPSPPPGPCAWPSHEHAHARARTLTRISGKASRSSGGCCCSTPLAPATVTALTGCAAGPRGP